MKPTKLEQYKYFQPIAWTLCLSFAGFVGMLAMQLDDQIQRMENSTLSFDQRLQVVEEAVGVTPPKPVKPVPNQVQ